MSNKLKNGKKSEKELDEVLVKEEDMSIAVMIIIVVLCFIVGISVGYMLYNLAMNSSNSALIVKDMLLR